MEWVAISFSRGSSRSRDRIHVSCIAGGLFTEPPWKPNFTNSQLYPPKWFQVLWFIHSVNLSLFVCWVVHVLEYIGYVNIYTWSCQITFLSRDITQFSVPTNSFCFPKPLPILYIDIYIFLNIFSFLKTTKSIHRPKSNCFHFPVNIMNVAGQFFPCW